MENKKNPKVDLDRRYGLFLSIGMCISLLLVITAFEWPATDDQGLVNLGEVNLEIEEIIEIPPTEQPPPPPPVVKLPEIIEVPDEKEIEEEIEIDLDIDVTPETVIEDIIVAEPEDEEADKIFEIVEDYPEFPGGMQAFFKYVGENMKYPSQARRMGIEGKVYVGFVVGIDGSLTEVKAIRGIGAGCNKEAERVIRESPKFKPGKQRGRPVKVRMVLPIYFKLSK